MYLIAGQRFRKLGGRVHDRLLYRGKVEVAFEGHLPIDDQAQWSYDDGEQVWNVHNSGLRADDRTHVAQCRRCHAATGEKSRFVWRRKADATSSKRPMSALATVSGVGLPVALSSQGTYQLKRLFLAS